MDLFSSLLYWRADENSRRECRGKTSQGVRSSWVTGQLRLRKLKDQAAEVFRAVTDKKEKESRRGDYPRIVHGSVLEKNQSQDGAPLPIMSEKFPNPKTQLWFSSATSLPAHQSPIHQKLVITFLAIYIEIP